MEVEEESPRGTLVGHLSAYDPDIGENALIDYIITGMSILCTDFISVYKELRYTHTSRTLFLDGNDNNVFYLNSSDNNMSELRVNGEIDRESVSEYVLTIKCFKRKTKAYSLQKIYNKQDPSERQVVIKVLDIDDNLPKFVDENITLGMLKK